MTSHRVFRMAGRLLIRAIATPVFVSRLSRVRVMLLTSLLALLFAVAPSTMAIEINFEYDAELTHPNDPSGAWIMFMANSAAAYWEDYLPEDGTYDIDIAYDQLGTSSGGGENYGLASPCGIGNAIWMDIDPSDGWFVDPTPFDHSEYDFITRQDPVWNSNTNRYEYGGGQWLYSDVSGGEQAAWFEGNPPASMEIGFRGSALAWSGPGPNGWAPPDTGVDMFSTMIHEIGHILGINSCEVGSPNWEAEPDWVGGIAGVEFERDDDSGHLDARTSLMCSGCGDTGLRRLPSAIDIMAVADDEGMETIDLPRKVHLQGIWHNALSWLGGSVPNSSDDTFIRHGDNLPLSANASARTLYISDESSLTTWDNELSISQRVDVVSRGSLPSEIAVSLGGQVDFNNLTLDGGILDLGGGLATLAGVTTITSNADFTGEISGQGTVDVFGVVVNDGRIVSDSTLGLTFNAVSVASRFDLDGSGVESGLVDARQGRLTFNGRLADAFSGVMRIGVGDPRSITMAYDWTLGTDGKLEFFGGSVAGSAARLLGPNATTTVKGRIEVDGVGLLDTKETVFETTAVVRAPDDGDRLILTSPTFFRGGTYIGEGALEQQADVQVWESTTIEMGEYDWGNSTVAKINNTYVNEGATFAIRSARTGTPRNEYRGTIYVTGSTLDVDLETGWLLPGRLPAEGKPAGTLNLTRGDNAVAKVTGAPLTVEGFLRANRGQAEVEANFISAPGGSVTALASAELLLKGRNTLGGGVFTGEGEIGQWGNTDVVADTAINTKYYDLDGSEDNPSTTAIGSGVTFSLNSERIEKPGGAFDGTVVADGGTLAVNTPSSWTLGETGTIRLVNTGVAAFVTGAPMIADGTVVTIGGNEIFSAITFRNSATVAAETPGDILRLRGVTSYEEGAYIGQGGIIQDASAFVERSTTVDLGFFDIDGVAENTALELHADLELNVDRVDMNDNQFHGTLQVSDPARLSVNTPLPWTMAGAINVSGGPGTVFAVAGADAEWTGDAFVGQFNQLNFEADISGPGEFTGEGTVEFSGQYSPGGSPAIVSAEGDVVFTDTATYFVEIGGTVPGAEHDVLVVNGEAHLDGMLDVDLVDLSGGDDPFRPLLGDEFRILRSGAGVSGEFAFESLPEVAPDLDWGVSYEENWLILELIERALEGDFDEDGDVDGADFLVWQTGFGQFPDGTAMHTDGDANGDGVVDGEDFLLWQIQFGTRSRDAGAGSVPEPGGGVLLLLLLLFSCRVAFARRPGVRLVN